MSVGLDAHWVLSDVQLGVTMYYAIETTYDDGSKNVTEKFDTYRDAAIYFHNKCDICHCRIVTVADVKELTMEEVIKVQEALKE